MTGLSQGVKETALSQLWLPCVSVTRLVMAITVQWMHPIFQGTFIQDTFTFVLDFFFCFIFLVDFFVLIWFFFVCLFLWGFFEPPQWNTHWNISKWSFKTFFSLGSVQPLPKPKPQSWAGLTLPARLLLPVGYVKVSLICIFMSFLSLVVILPKEHKVVIVHTSILGSSKCFWSRGLAVMTLDEARRGGKGDEVILISVTASVCRTRI